RARTGVCSGQCAERSQSGDQLPVFVQRNENFRLPNNPDTPVIMIGAGTGVAPYRAFLQEREEIGARGETWLFFGEQHFVTDFLYQVEW
ncbi:NADPH-dependent assimilatory sulfite reductase flavoprotein subunit, partial [Pantoea sp. SIMBA_133]